MRVIWKVAVGLAFFLTASPPLLSAQDYRAQALRILKTVPLIDGHNDIPDAIRQRGGRGSGGVPPPPPQVEIAHPQVPAGAEGKRAATFDGGGRKPPNSAAIGLERALEPPSL